MLRTLENRALSLSRLAILFQSLRVDPFYNVFLLPTFLGDDSYDHLENTTTW